MSLFVALCLLGALAAGLAAGRSLRLAAWFLPVVLVVPPLVLEQFPAQNDSFSNAFYGTLVGSFPALLIYSGAVAMVRRHELQSGHYAVFGVVIAVIVLAYVAWWFASF